ncbi:MAG: acyl-CoA dehydrogenase [Gammaproteobacteria bacterium]
MSELAQAIAEDPTTEHNMLRDSAITFCARDAEPGRLKALKQTDMDFDPAVWQQMVELGWAAILVPEDCDGLGLNLAAAAVVLEQLGRVVAPEPMLETAGFAVNVLTGVPVSPDRDALLRDIAGGARCPVVCAAQYQRGTSAGLPHAQRKGNDSVLAGSADCIALARSADVFIVAADDAGELLLCLLAADTAGVTVESRQLADNTTHARVTFADVAVSADAIIARGGDAHAALDRAIDANNILSAAYLGGLMSQALDTTLDYLRTRKQFGRTIGSFQALQHRAVDMFIQRDLAGAVVADALAGIESPDADRRAILASRAIYRAGVAALAITREAIQMHGAIGFTYECDIGHYLNRAMVLSARQGNAARHLRELGGLLRRAGTDDPNDGLRGEVPADPADGDWNSLDDESFRHIVRAWLEAEYPEALRYPPRRLDWAEIKPWYMQLSAKGWLAPSWPVEHGGMGLSPSKVLVFMEEQERWGVARAPDMGIVMIGPLLIQHGTPEQRDNYLPKILAGENVWCQGYSEPNSGSDLASLQCEAVLDGDEFVVNGQKTWTTMAQHATHIFLLVRTDKSVKQQAGISFLLADVTSPGITIRPIRNLAGDEEFCEVFFDDVRVPAENIVGEMNNGWRIAKALLSFERIFLGSPKQSQYALQRLESIAAGRGLFDDPGFLDRFTRLKLDTLDLESVYATYAQIVRDGGTLGPDVSMLKIWATETFARLTELMLEAAGEFGAERGDLNFGAGRANILSQFYNSRPATIYGGSNEIQRNILAKNVLDLPAT